MGVSCRRETKDLCVISLSGVFSDQDRRDLEDFGKTAIERSGGKVKVLILTEEFSGWARKGNWNDISFMLENDASIERIAVVADEQWHDNMLMYLGAGMRNAKVKVFSRSQEDRARVWLG